MQNSLIIQKHAGHAIPDGYIEKFMSVYASTWGAAFLTDDNRILLASQDEGLSRDTLDDLMIKLMDKEMILFVSQAHEVQPYIPIKKGDEYLCLLFMEGNFKNRLNSDETISNEQAVFEKMIKPQLQTAFAFSDEDISKLRAEVEEDKVTGQLLSLIEDRGNMLFYFPDGAYKLVKGNTSVGSYPWGWVTNHLGFTEGIETPEVKETAPAPKPSALDMFKGGVSAVASAAGKVLSLPAKPASSASPPLAAKPAALAKPASGPVLQPPAKPAAGTGPQPDVKDVGKQVVYYRVKDKTSNNKTKDMYKIAGYSLEMLPGWKDYPVVEVAMDRWTKYSKGLLEHGEVVTFDSMTDELKAKFSKTAGVPPGEIKATTTTADGKVTSETVKTSVPAAPAKPATQDTHNIQALILSGERRKAIISEDMAVLDKSSIDIDDPVKMGELVKKFPPLDIQTGKGEFWRKWSPESLQKFFSKHPDAAAILIFHQNARLAAFERMSKQQQPEQKKAAGIKK